MRISIQTTSNQIIINLNQRLRFRKAKVVKFKFLPDNITNVNLINLSIDNMNQNQVINNGVVYSYFWCIPFVNSNAASAFSSDTSDLWDYENTQEQIHSQFIIYLRNESGQLITMNNSNVTIEILFD